jgi:hypothetical protein
LNKATGPRLQRPQRGAFLAGPLGHLIARPWFDRVALWSIRRQILPGSRLWAAATVSDGDVDRFVDAVGRAPVRMPSRAMLRRALAQIVAEDRAFCDVDRAWDEGFFGDTDVGEPALIDLERQWRRRSQIRAAGRRHVAPFVRRIRPPCVRYAIPSPADVAAQFDPGRPPNLAAPANGLEPTRSRAIRTSYGIEYWLTGASPIAGDALRAHVYEPAGIENPPTAILCHGLAMETEMLNGIVDSTLWLLSQGIRVVLPSAPDHNRRCKPGWYGGEALLATQPLGAIEHLQAMAYELAILVRWARARSAGAPVAVGGISLGALTAQFMADRTRDWPPECRPDALLLMTTSAMAGMLPMVSSLARALDLPAALESAGWDAPALARLSPLTDPQGPAPLDPANILMLVATHDTVTPADDGMVLARRWMLPADNVILRDRGHFSAAIGLLFDRAPYMALTARLNARRQGLF